MIAKCVLQLLALLLCCCAVQCEHATGDKLSVALVDNAAAAAELLAWHNRTAGQQGFSKALRIWDMQRLQAWDKSHQQRKAQAAFPAGVLILHCFVL